MTQFLHAQWLFPGDAGEAIQRADDNGVVIAEVNQLDEPTVRSRTFGGFSEGGGDAVPSAADKDAMRTWLLRNRIRPDTLRAEVLAQLQLTQDPMTGMPWIEGLPANAHCGLAPDPDHQAFFVAMLQSEERIPAGHSLTRHLSPFLPSTVVLGDTGTSRLDSPAMVSVYPDLRSRDTRQASPTTIAPGLGALHDAVRFVRFEDGATCEGVSQNAPLPRHPSPQYILADETQPLGERRYAAELNANLALRTTHWCAAVFLDNALDHGATSPYRRFIPAAQRAVLSGPMWPNGQWHPCLFQDDGDAHPGELFPVQTLLFADIAAQTELEMAVRSSDGVLGRDTAHSIAQDDDSRWCTCDACTHADEYGVEGSDGGALSLHLGTVVSRNRYNLDILLRTTPTFDTVPITSSDDLVPPALRGISIHELCMRGVIENRGYLSRRSRRMITLAQGVAQHILSQFDGDPLWGVAPDEAGRAHYIRHHVISTMAYFQFASPPMMLHPLAVSPRGGDDRVQTTPALGEQLPSPVLVFVSECRDTVEYDLDYPLVPPGTIAQAAERMRRWPQQFNHERWAMVASRTGMYEYIQAKQFVVPRIYTRRLQRAVQHAVDRFGMRAFVSETRSAAGIMGPMLWELAQVLWDPTSIVETMRDTWCVAAFGPASTRMTQYFTEAEDAWSVTRGGEPDYATGGTKPDRRTNSDNADGYFGQGFVGRVSRISQFAGLMRPSAVPGRRVYQRLGQLLDDAVHTPGCSEAQTRRIQLFRRTFKFVQMIAQWYQPLYDALEMIRQANATSPMGRTKIEGMAALNQLYIDVPPASPGGMPTLRGYDIIQRTGVLPVEIQRGVLACLGDELLPGILKLRRRVHLYLSEDNLHLQDDGTLVTREDPHDEFLVGFGMFSTERGVNDPAFMNEPTDSEQRFAGLYWPDVKGYVAWRNMVRGRGPVLDRELTATLRRRPDAPGHLGWLFREMKQLAKVVVLYCPGFMDPSSVPNVTSVYNAIQGG